MKCPICGGTGDTTNNIPPTNEQWFCSLSTEEKAKELFRQRLFGAVSQKGILKWLKQPHTDS